MFSFKFIARLDVYEWLHSICLVLLTGFRFHPANCCWDYLMFESKPFSTMFTVKTSDTGREFGVSFFIAPLQALLLAVHRII